jgi:restriction system protein
MKYIIIVLLLLIIVVSYFFKPNYKKRKHKSKIATGDKIIEKLNSFQGQYKNQQILTYLRKIDPYVFEELLLSAFELKGFKIIRNKSYSGDGGLDGMIDTKEGLILIQAKRYSNVIKRAQLEDFSCLIAKKKAIGGYFVHTGKTAVKNYQEYKNSNIKIISGEKLIDIILRTKS